MDCVICQLPMIYVPPSEREKWSFSSEDGPIKNSDGAPYEDKHVPVLIHKRHCYHRVCISDWLKKDGEIVESSLYRKILSVFLPCVKNYEIRKGSCPEDRETIVSAHFVENTALIDFQEGVMPLPEGYDEKATVKKVEKKRVMEVAFASTIIFITVAFVWLADLFGCGPKQERGTSNSMLYRSAKIYNITDQDFNGYEAFAAFFLHQERNVHQTPR